MDPENKRWCSCGAPLRWVEDPSVPIGIKSHRYLLYCDEGYWLLAFCFVCGGRLTTDGGAHPVADPDELAQFHELTAGCSSIEEVTAVLGSPSNITAEGAISGALREAYFNNAYRTFKVWALERDSGLELFTIPRE